MRHVEWWLGPFLGEAFRRSSAGVVADKLGRFEAAVLEKGKGAEEGEAAEMQSFSPTSPMASLVGRPAPLLARLARLYVGADGRFLALLEVLCRIMGEALARSPVEVRVIPGASRHFCFEALSTTVRLERMRQRHVPQLMFPEMAGAC
jgi:hypothetical protein